MSKQVVTIRIAGQDYRIRSEADEAHLQAVATFVDETMARIRKRTGAVDSVEVALLTSLNLARDLLDLRERSEGREDGVSVADERLRELIERVESVELSAAS